MASDVDLEAMSTAHCHLDGYPSFSKFIARDKDAAIYRRFENLSSRNLLYLQSELHDLERQLEEIDHEDAKDIDNERAQAVARHWVRFSQDSDNQALARRTLQEKIKIKINEYHKAMMLESQILSLNGQSSRTLKDFKRWFTSGSFRSGSTLALWGRDEHLFDDEDDLVALAPADTDRLNLFLKSYCGWFFKVKEEPSKKKGRSQSDIFYYPTHRIQRAGALISVSLSAILLIGAIVCLTAVTNRSTSVRVGRIVLFTCLFAGVVGLLTNARRAEIFGSTAA